MNFTCKGSNELTVTHTKSKLLHLPNCLGLFNYSSKPLTIVWFGGLMVWILNLLYNSSFFLIIENVTKYYIFLINILIQIQRLSKSVWVQPNPHLRLTPSPVVTTQIHTQRSYSATEAMLGSDQIKEQWNNMYGLYFLSRNLFTLVWLIFNYKTLKRINKMQKVLDRDLSKR